MVIYGVSFDMVGKQPIVLLKTVESNKFLPIWIGHPEAAAILMKLQGASTPRPMTHDLLCDMLGELDVKCTQVAVTELRDNTFFASITLAVNGREMEIDSRPSDALALAVRSGAPIYAAEEVITESAIEFEHEVEDTEEVVRADELGAPDLVARFEVVEVLADRDRLDDRQRLVAEDRHRQLAPVDRLLEQDLVRVRERRHERRRYGARIGREADPERAA